MHVGSIQKDHIDPSIFCVLTAKSKTPGAPLADFLIFSGRWDVATGTQLWTSTGTVLRWGTSPVRCAAVLGPEATHFAVWFCDSAIQLWDTQQETVLTLDHESGVDTLDQHLVFASGGQRLLSWRKRGTSLKLWDTRNGQNITLSSGFRGSDVRHACFSPDGQIFATASSEDSLVEIGKALDGSWLATYAVSRPAHGVDWPTYIEVSSDGTHVLVGTRKGHIYPFPLPLPTSSVATQPPTAV